MRRLYFRRTWVSEPALATIRTMSRIVEPPLQPWSPPSYQVDAAGKVVGARPEGPNNWGRWGENDQRGTANLLTPEGVLAARGLIRTGRAFSLALPIGRGAKVAGTRPPAMHMLTSGTSDSLAGHRSAHGVQSSDDIVVMPLQTATHIDGLAHFGADDVMYNGFWTGLTTSGSGARRLGAEHLAGGLSGRGVLVDVARHHYLDPFTGVIDADLLEATLQRQQVAPAPGDILLVRTGWLGTFLTAEKTPRTRQAGLAPSTADWLHDHDIAVVAADNRAVEALPNPEGSELLPFHRRAIRDLGLLLGELFDLDELSEHCHAEGVYEGFFTAAPLPFVGSFGSPVNPLFIL
jgi:kynurenine formamidase